MRRFLAFAAILCAASLAAQDLAPGRMVKLNGMQQPGMVIREANGIPHIFALDTHDAWFLNGWLHAQDRLFQMDSSRRIASGTLAELVGSDALSTDVQLRTLGLRRAAEATLPAIGAEARAALTAYTQGVNAYLQAHPGQLPPEYSLLGIGSVEPWTEVDSLAVGKLIAFGLSFDLDIDATVALISYETAGKIVGFDGSKLFTDTWRVAPFTAAATIPDATGSGSTLPIRLRAAAASASGSWNASWVKPETVSMLRKYGEEIRNNDVLQAAIDPQRHAGSNEWAIAPKNSATGNALVANDPHLSLTEPPNFYPLSVRVPGKLNVAGMGFPGAPFVIQGQNERIAWGSTVHPMDVTDIYQEQLVPDASSPSGLSSLYLGQKEHVIPIPQTFRVYVPGHGLMPAPAGSVPPVTLIVPRHGPIIEAPDPKTGIAVSVQYVGFYPTHELEAFMLIDQARNADDFKNALQSFDFGSQNFAYADVDGNIGYFTGGEMPIREDLQAGKVDGLPPYFIRNGQGGNEWMPVSHPQPQQTLPYEILPYSEMPQVLNPSNGWFVNANNDPIGQTLDNNPLNSVRPGGGIYYLNPGYDGFRAGRITELVRQKLAGGGKISFSDMQAIQADTGLIDAQVFVPYIVKALQNALATGANPILASLGANPAVAGAVGLLTQWDFSTPTGLDNGYDASSKLAPAIDPQTKISHSVAATIYAAWRSKFLANTIDVVLKTLTVPLPPDQQTLSELRFQLDHFDATGGRGTSGLDFFNVPGVNDAATRRDILILKSVADGLTMLSSDAFAAAFDKSTNPTDYRWGKLHRVVFSHLLGNLYSPGAPYGQPPLPTLLNLPGVAVDGGFSTVDAASHSARASTVNGFMFGGGPNRRAVVEMEKGAVHGESSLPGGVSGDPRSPWFTNLLMQWLVNGTFTIVPDRFPVIPWLP